MQTTCRGLTSPTQPCLQPAVWCCPPSLTACWLPCRLGNTPITLAARFADATPRFAAKQLHLVITFSVPSKKLALTSHSQTASASAPPPYFISTARLSGTAISCWFLILLLLLHFLHSQSVLGTCLAHSRLFNKW